MFGGVQLIEGESSIIQQQVLMFLSYRIHLTILGRFRNFDIFDKLLMNSFCMEDTE